MQEINADFSGWRRWGFWFTTDLSTWTQIGDIAGPFLNVITGDFDGDGRDDVAGLSEEFIIWYGTQMGIYWTPLPTSLRGTLVVGDFNGDGYDDIAGLTPSGAIYYVTDMENFIRIPGTLTQLAVGDFNADGCDDLAGINSASGNMYYTLNKQSWVSIPGVSGVTFAKVYSAR